MERQSNVDKNTVAIQMTDIVKKFGDFTANDHIHLTVHKGEVHAILGEKRRRKKYADEYSLRSVPAHIRTIAIDGKEVVIDSPQKAIDMESVWYTSISC